MTKGIDVSSWQEDIDFKKVKKSGVKFVIIRAGFGTRTEPDKYFERNYRGAADAGLHVGAYWYSYAESGAQAHEEARACLDIIKGKKFDFPIFYDLEEQSQFVRGMDFCSNLVRIFCNQLEENDCFAGLYTSRYPLQHYISRDVASRYAVWVAEYNPTLNYRGNYGIWQYSSTGKVDGINGAVDLDYCYVDYPKIIKAAGLNGYSSGAPVPEKTVKEVALEVIRGDWGNGDERYDRLTAAGYDYYEVQREVNRLLYG
ncbi:MAG: hypothetical protein NC299_01225 [Lachnospiraceae bacterium]|nr:hypothetical protein [Ruminococcus sp.]MCM1273970.1 hypothetical protein [Lachnospiraceae bacterium]